MVAIVREDGSHFAYYLYISSFSVFFSVQNVKISVNQYFSVWIFFQLFSRFSNFAEST